MAYAWELESRGIPASAFRLGELNRETEYVLRTLNLETPPLLESVSAGDPVAVVDTNNPKELPDGMDRAVVHSIVDHHKLSGLITREPLEVDMRALCSTGSILYARAKAAGRTPPPHVAGLMLSCILSDSLVFRSPTTTALDRQFAEELALISGLEMQKHGDAMLDAKADIGHLSAKELIMMDSKVYTIGGLNMRISVLETTRPGAALAKRAALQDAMRQTAQEQGLDEVLLFVVDVLDESATFVSSSTRSAEMVGRAWGSAVGRSGTAKLPGVLSRKKQIVPALEAAADVAAERAEPAGSRRVQPAQMPRAAV